MMLRTRGTKTRVIILPTTYPSKTDLLKDIAEARKELARTKPIIEPSSKTTPEVRGQSTMALRPKKEGEPQLQAKSKRSTDSSGKEMFIFPLGFLSSCMFGKHPLLDCLGEIFIPLEEGNGSCMAFGNSCSVLFFPRGISQGFSTISMSIRFPPPGEHDKRQASSNSFLQQYALDFLMENQYIDERPFVKTSMTSSSSFWVVGPGFAKDDMKKFQILIYGGVTFRHTSHGSLIEYIGIDFFAVGVGNLLLQAS